MLAFVVSFDDGEEAGAVEIDIGVEVAAVEVVEPRRPLLRDVFVAEVLADEGAILSLGQRNRWNDGAGTWSAR